MALEAHRGCVIQFEIRCVEDMVFYNSGNNEMSKYDVISGRTGYITMCFFPEFATPPCAVSILSFI